MKLVRGISLILLVMTAAVCGRGGEQPDHRFTVENVGGATIATTRGGPRFEGELFEYEHLLTLQQDEQAPESLLANPMIFTRTTEGNYAVIDNGRVEKRIVLYDQNGRFLKTFGGSGSGPGEFVTMIYQGCFEDVLNIYDFNQRRLTRFRSGGELVDVIRVPGSHESPVSSMYAASTGELVIMNLDLNASEATTIRFDVSDREGNQLASYESEEIKTGERIDVGGGFMMPYFIPFAPAPMAVYRPGKGILASTGTEPVLRWYDLNGRLTREIKVEDLPAALTGEDRANFEASWKKLIEGAPEAARADAARMRDDLEAAIPEVKPPWSYVAVDDEGYYWLRVQEEPDPWTVYIRDFAYRILSPDGEYLGITRLPAPENITGNVQPLSLPISVAQGHYMGITRDEETGERHLHVYRLKPAAEGFVYP